MTEILRTVLFSIMTVILFLLIHLFKMMRLYLILLEEKTEFKRFVFAYFRTTLVNLVIPFKLGELYRIAAFSGMTKSLLKGTVSIICDRFFDTLALVLIMLPLQILYKDTVSPVSVFLTVFLIAVLFVFRVFPSAYGYLNRYIIIYRSSRRSMAVLKSLEVLKGVYDGVRDLVSGRYAIMIIMSFGAWIFEGMLLYSLSRLLGISFDARDFCEYVSSILSPVHYAEIQKPYAILGIVILSVFTCLSGAYYFARTGGTVLRSRREELFMFLKGSKKVEK
ncbi:MAG: flippase-like domain-containing protein [Lachnospiraceae bacterium]|nr:flippase-like domain-containing protein [Lachnospiraceae bacterium]